MESILGALGQVLTLLTMLGVVFSWPFIYYINGFQRAKAVHGVDWREFAGAMPLWWLGRWLFWYVVVIAWLAKGRPPARKAVVELDGRPCRAVVSQEDFVVTDAIGTSRRP